jgi:hypothetical protein
MTANQVSLQNLKVFSIAMLWVYRGAPGWSGMIPRRSHSGTNEAKGLPISEAGPDLIKKFSFLGVSIPP